MWLRPLGILILSMPNDTQSIQLCATIDIPNNIYSVYSAVQNGEPRQYISTTPLQPITPTLLSGKSKWMFLGKVRLVGGGWRRDDVGNVNSTQPLYNQRNTYLSINNTSFPSTFPCE